MATTRADRGADPTGNDSTGEWPAGGGNGRTGNGIREQIVEAAERVIQGRGLAAATTRAIAEEAGCAEGSIYRHFADKHEVFLEVVKRRFPLFLETMASLPDRAGTGSVRRHLEEIALVSLQFYRAILPMVTGIMSNHELMEHQRQHFRQSNSGPMRAVGCVGSYVRLEQRLGRISDRVPPEQVSRTILGSCFFQAYLEVVLQQEAGIGSDEQFARDLARGLFEGLRPRPATAARADA
jgi:AcrR family transcriptional regulator